VTVVAVAVVVVVEMVMVTMMHYYCCCYCSYLETNSHGSLHFHHYHLHYFDYCDYKSIDHWSSTIVDERSDGDDRDDESVVHVLLVKKIEWHCDEDEMMMMINDGGVDGGVVVNDWRVSWTREEQMRFEVLRMIRSFSFFSTMNGWLCVCV